MKTVQMTVDEPLLSEVDEVVKSLHTTRSAFVRQALQLALRRYKTLTLERQHAEGYAKQPVHPGEFDAWVAEQAWGEP